MTNLLSETNLFAMLINAIEPVFNKLWLLFIIIPLSIFAIVLAIGILKTKLGIYNCDYESANSGKHIVKVAFISAIVWVVLIVILEILFAVY